MKKIFYQISNIFRPWFFVDTRAIGIFRLLLGTLCFIDISRTLKKKLNALKAYKSEMKSWPHSRSIKAIESLARWRGSSVGLKAAESFIIIRELL